MPESSTEVDQLSQRFARAAAEAGARGPATPVFLRLLERYREPQRRYHDLSHVAACLGWLDWFRSSAARPDEVELGLWFHDAVYDPRRVDNEQRSAELARVELSALGVRPESIEAVAQLVEATRAHDASGGDAALLVDIDLAILGARRHEFEQFELSIREEYGHVPEAAFRAGRAHVLSRFLARPVLYRTPMLREELEERARENLERRLRELSARA